MRPNIGPSLFLLYCFIAMYLLRKVGWALSRAFLYTAPWIVCIPFLCIWGVGIAYGFRHLVMLCYAGWIVKTIGYGSAAYLSIPNYGLVSESSIPVHAQARHFTISNLSFGLFIVFSIIFAFTIHAS